MTHEYKALSAVTILSVFCAGCILEKQPLFLTTHVLSATSTKASVLAVIADGNVTVWPYYKYEPYNYRYFKMTFGLGPAEGKAELIEVGQLTTPALKYTVAHATSASSVGLEGFDGASKAMRSPIQSGDALIWNTWEQGGRHYDLVQLRRFGRDWVIRSQNQVVTTFCLKQPDDILHGKFDYFSVDRDSHAFIFIQGSNPYDPIAVVQCNAGIITESHVTYYLLDTRACFDQISGKLRRQLISRN